MAREYQRYHNFQTSVKSHGDVVYCGADLENRLL
ncbi:unnamed protein product [Arabidopsis thaliana]|uniref:Uncharacterized protein n=2 Tax=Arabidopsis thaliana TaxID=3702 RepID=A0A654EVJ8_ARATH|nr:uncharacterized protein AT2G23834 [Arabidopsis thaliana]AEC07497.1 hypothetical protein AT2G23834 [Arabidopsis thaliana]VYS53304.1 unnamed protein product [Arabidopsis thaliana]|eukprot:NP_001118374.1 hypothetical protein AT2G23834 [Arabidopsis thaliana]